MRGLRATDPRPAVVAALWLLAGGSGGAHAQTSSPGQCSAGDEACYLRLYESACARRRDSWVVTCESLVRSFETGPERGDRAALKVQGLAHIMLATRPESDAAESPRHRAAALTIYRKLVEENPSELDSLHGLAAVTEDPGQRLELLRTIVGLQPSPIVVRSLTSLLRRSGRPEDLVEAAEANDMLYESGGGTKLEIAGDVIDLYRQAGAQDQADAVRQRVRREFNTDGLLDGLSRTPLADSDKSIAALRTLCHPSMFRSVDARSCIRGMEAVLQAIPPSGGEEGVQRVADVAVGFISRLATEAESALASFDPDWRARFTRELDALLARGFASVPVYGVRSWLEPEAAVRVELLERALRLAPDHRGLLEELAYEYEAARDGTGNTQ